MKSAYISYSRRDRGIANEIASMLSMYGVRTFIDIEELSVGSNFAEQLTQRLNAADVVIYIVSEASLNSQWCRREIEYAKAKGKTIIPIAVTEGILNEESYKDSVVSTFLYLVWDRNGREKLLELLQKIDAKKYSTNQEQTINNRCVYASPPKTHSAKGCGCFVVFVLIVIVALYFVFYRTASTPEKSLPISDEDSYVYSTPPTGSTDTEEDEWIIVDSSVYEDTIAADTMAVIDPFIEDESSENVVDYPTEQDSTLYQKPIDIKSEESEDVSPYENGSSDYTYWLFILLTIALGIAGYWRYSKRHVRVKLVANRDCSVYADNKEIANIKANTVTFVSLHKGEYFLLFKPSDEKTEQRNITVRINKQDELVSMNFPEIKQEDRKAIKCFIAGSTKLEAERNALRSGIAQTHNAWRGKNFEILSYTYEDFERKVVDGGHQSKYDEFIEKEATIAVFIISGEIGEFTITEFEKAMKAFKNGMHPQILVFNDINAPAHEQSDKLKAMVSAQKQYWANYDSINALKLQFMHTLDWMLIDMFYK